MAIKLRRGVLAMIAEAQVLASMPVPMAMAQTATVHIETASWGYASSRKNVKDDVAKLCDGKPSCAFMVKNETFALLEPLDPAPGSPKGLIMVWTCGATSKKDQFPENKTATVACP